MRSESRPNGVRSTHGPFAPVRVPEVCQQVSRRVSAEIFSCWDQFLAMAFAQFTCRESLRDIEACLRSVGGKLYDAGFRGKVARSTLADANESRLETLRRLRASSDPHRATALRS